MTAATEAAGSLAGLRVVELAAVGPANGTTQVALARRFSRTPAGLPPPMADPVDIDDVLAGRARLPAARPTVGEPAA